MRRSSLLAAALVALPVLAVAGRATAAPPPTPRHPVNTVMHGVTVHDPYRWLEDAGTPAVKQWIAAQNKHTEAVIDAMPSRKAISKRVRDLAITSTTRRAPHLAGGTLFYLRQTPPQPQPVLVAQPWPHGKARVLVDPNADGGRTAITGFWPSPSGRYLAYGTAEGGSELTTLHVLDVRTGKELADTLPYAGGGTTPAGLAWDADAHGFTYVRFPPPPKGRPVRQFDAVLVHHVLGQPAARDRVVFGRHYSHVAEYRLLSSPGARHLAVLANIGDGGAAEVYLREHGRFQRVLGRKADVREARWDGQRLLAAAFENAPRGRILAIDPDGGHHVLARQQMAGAVQSVAPVAGGFLVTYSWGPEWWVQQFDENGHPVRRVPLPAHGIGVGAIASEADSAHALITYSGWKQPTRWVDYDAHGGSLKAVFKVHPATDYSSIRVRRIEGISADGTHVPVTVLSMRGVTPNGRRPTILYGYGGFDIPMRPHFAGPLLAWLERGGVYAVANIRGGNEFGEAWHRGGMTVHKQNVFDDFHAAAQALLKTGWTDRAHLGIMGGSNGGLLMGAELTQHPHDFRAVVSMVGIYDMIRHQTAFANGAYNVTEYGNVHDAAQFRALYAYSPLFHVKPHTAYPAVLMTTGANDARVAPWQSRKFTAALQRASDSGRPILLLTRMHEGHGVDASFSQRVGNTALALTFFAHELGLKGAASDAH